MEEPIDFKYKSTTLCMAINFELDGRSVYTVERSIEFYDDTSKNPVSYGFVSTSVDRYLNDDEIRSVVVRYLAQHKLYLHNYVVKSRKTFVSYNSDSPKIEGLQYGAASYSDYIFLKVLAQVEDGVDYNKIFDTRIRGAIREVSNDELVQAGYDIDGYVSIEHDTLLGADELPAELVDAIQNGSDNFELPQ